MEKTTMFWGNKALLEEVQRELAQVKAESQQLRNENDGLRQQLANVEGEFAHKISECDTLKGVLQQLSLFNETLAGSQQSLGQMAVLLGQEKKQAIAAAEVSISSGKTTTEIADNLH